MLFGRSFCRLVFATWFALGAHLLVAQEPAVPAATDPAKPLVAEPPVAPIGDGLLRFAFQDTPWRDVIKWLADQSLLA